MSHLMNRGNILSPSRNIVRGEHDIFPKKVYSIIAKTNFSNNFYEKLNLFAIITW